MTMPPDSFVLHRDNQKYLTGKSTRIASIDGSPRCGLVFGVVLMGLGLWAMWAVSQRWLIWQVLKLDGAVAQATVLELHQEKNDAGEPVSRVRYRLLVEGQAFERDGFASATSFAALKKDGPVRVVYSRASPAFSRILNESSGQLALWPLVPCGILVGLGGYCIWRSRRLHRLLRFGQLIPGVVRRCEGAADADGFLVRLDYAFRSPEQRQVHASVQAYRDDLQGQPLPMAGTALAVLYVDESNHQVL